MAASDAELCSDALLLVGAEPIVALTDNSDRARWCNRLYPKLRDGLLRKLPWNCALTRQALAQLTTGPLFGFAYAFQLPVDCLRVWATSLDREQGGDGDPWQIEGRALVTNISAVSALYVRQVADVGTFDALLERALRYELAANLAYPISQNATLQQGLAEIAAKALRDAMGVDGQEGTKRRYRSTMLTTDVR